MMKLRETAQQLSEMPDRFQESLGLLQQYARTILLFLAGILAVGILTLVRSF